MQMAGEEDDVIVVDCRGNMQTGCLGGMLMTALATKGCAGLVVDGCVRDLPEAMELGPNATNPYPPRFIMQIPLSNQTSFYPARLRTDTEKRWRVCFG